jgi:hypothetical protein
VLAVVVELVAATAAVDALVVVVAVDVNKLDDF